MYIHRYGFYRGYIPLLQLDFPFTAVNFALFSTYQNLVPVLFNHQVPKYKYCLSLLVQKCKY